MRALAIILGFLVALSLWGCVYDDYVVPVPPPVPPTPVPPEPPPPPDPGSTVSREVFSDVEIGGPASQIEALPEWSKKTTVGDRIIYSWTLDEPRPGGGHVRWEVHVEGGEVIASFPW